MGQLSFTEAEYSNRRRRTKREDFLDLMDEIIPWKEWAEIIRPYYHQNTRGRRAKEIETMLASANLLMCIRAGRIKEFTAA